jgi:hypothetical protein
MDASLKTNIKIVISKFLFNIKDLFASIYALEKEF